MADSWKDMKKTKEEEFFEKQNKAALARLKTGEAPRNRLCPCDGEILTIMHVSNIEVDQCPKCHGVWLDAGELEHLLKDSNPQTARESVDIISGFLQKLFGK